jgi:flavin reductase (DIM6/NTAB) family NADH-FMN oxidoreductase RutF
VPRLKDALAHFDCRVIATFTSGTHTLFIGEVLQADGSVDGRPLVYFNRAYHTLSGSA